MKSIIIDRINAIEAYKAENKIVPTIATSLELQSAIRKLYEKELESMKADGTISVAGHTVNGHEHLVITG